MSEIPLCKTENGRIFFEQILPALMVELARVDEFLSQMLESLPAAPTPVSPNREEQAS